MLMQTTDIFNVLVQLLRMSMGCEPVATVQLTARQWRELYRMACQQTLVGVVYGVVKQMDETTRPPLDVMLEWTARAEAIKGYNRKMNEMATSLTKWFDEHGRHSVILKGQANARLYPHPEERQPGDIDIYVEGGRQEVLELLRKHGMMDDRAEVIYHHVHLPPQDNMVSVEVHFRPSSGNYNPFTNNRLQRVLNKEIAKTEVCAEGFNVPTVTFALLMQLSHIQRHFLGGGIGLRQITDYYLLLKHADDNDRQRVTAQLARLGLRQAAGAVMWLMQQLFSMPTTLMIAAPDARRGAWLLDEIKTGGNFGFHAAWQHLPVWQFFFKKRERALRLYRFNCSENIWVELAYWWNLVRRIPERVKYRKWSLRKTK